MKSSDSRLRRGCVTDGHEITDNTEAQPKAGQLTGNMGTGSSVNTSDVRELSLARVSLMACHLTGAAKGELFTVYLK